MLFLTVVQALFSLPALHELTHMTRSKTYQMLSSLDVGQSSDLALDAISSVKGRLGRGPMQVMQIRFSHVSNNCAYCGDCEIKASCGRTTLPWVQIILLSCWFSVAPVGSIKPFLQYTVVVQAGLQMPCCSNNSTLVF